MHRSERKRRESNRIESNRILVLVLNRSCRIGADWREYSHTEAEAQIRHRRRHSGSTEPRNAQQLPVTLSHKNVIWEVSSHNNQTATGSGVLEQRVWFTVHSSNSRSGCAQYSHSPCVLDMHSYARCVDTHPQLQTRNNRAYSEKVEITRSQQKSVSSV